MVERVKRSYKLRPETAKVIDKLANESNSYKSDIVDRAVSEYADNDRAARIEAKLDAVLEEQGIGGAPSEKSEAKKKKDATDNDRGHSPTPEEYRSETGVDLSEKCPANGNGLNKSERSQVFFELATLDRDRVTLEDIDAAIEEGWGDASNHMISNYRPRVRQLLNEEWITVVGTDDGGVWARNEDVLLEVVDQTEADLRDRLQGTRDADKIHSLKRQIASLQNTVTDYGLDGAPVDQVSELMGAISSRT